jgi:aspartyl-tRNA(Asn)/glutamyl-tRNA(Gln) amidotransferase subunit C
MSETINTKDLEHLALLANLPLDKKTAPKLKDELNQILGYVGKLQQIDTSKVDPTAEITGLTNVFQAGAKHDCLSQSEALSAAAKSRDGFVEVKGVFEESSDV